MSLPTPSETVEKLQTSLQTKAKAEPAFRFYALWDKVCRPDVLQEAYRRCRANAGAAGVDRKTFEQIDAQGVDRWLEKLRVSMPLQIRSYLLKCSQMAVLCFGALDCPGRP